MRLRVGKRDLEDLRVGIAPFVPVKYPELPAIV
jgi:hypothetical protein